MYKKRARQLTADLTRKLCAKPASAYVGLERGRLTELLQHLDAPGRFEALLTQEGRVSCARTAEVWAEVLAAAAPVPEEGWLSFTYRFACNILFPQQAFAERSRRQQQHRGHHRLNPAHRLYLLPPAPL